MDTLQKLKATAEELGYSTKFEGKGGQVAYDTLSILWENKEGEEQYLDIIIYPLSEDLDGSIFVQFYAEYPFKLTEENLMSVVNALPMANNKLPLGHFAISADRETLYYKYVLALPMEYGISTAFLNDVLDMCIYAYEGFLNGFQSLCL